MRKNHHILLGSRGCVAVLVRRAGKCRLFARWKTGACTTQGAPSLGDIHPFLVAVSAPVSDVTTRCDGMLNPTIMEGDTVIRTRGL